MTLISLLDVCVGNDFRLAPTEYPPWAGLSLTAVAFLTLRATSEVGLPGEPAVQMRTCCKTTSSR